MLRHEFEDAPTICVMRVPSTSRAVGCRTFSTQPASSAARRQFMVGAGLSVTLSVVPMLRTESGAGVPHWPCFTGPRRRSRWRPAPAVAGTRASLAACSASSRLRRRAQAPGPAASAAVSCCGCGRASRCAASMELRESLRELVSGISGRACLGHARGLGDECAFRPCRRQQRQNRDADQHRCGRPRGRVRERLVCGRHAHLFPPCERGDPIRAFLE